MQLPCFGGLLEQAQSLCARKAQYLNIFLDVHTLLVGTSVEKYMKSLLLGLSTQPWSKID